MKGCWDNKGRIIFSVVFLVFCSMLLALCFILPGKATSGPYLDSAHGNYTPSPGYGVKRNPTLVPQLDGYAIGNCAHCHEQHASIGGSEPAPTGGPDKYDLLANNFSGKTTNLYIQSDNVCFYCHTTSASTLQSPSFNNYSYSITFGGNPDTTPNNIFDMFNSLSYHNLNDIYRFITGASGSHSNFTNFPADSNPCSGCHNIHIAKRSCNKPPLANSYDPTKSAISKPSDHGNLWGDDTSERMNPNYTSNYQAPYWYNSTTYFEPYSTNTIQDGTNLPDYATFCTDCHNTTNTIYSTTLGRNLRTIDWANEKHGKGNAVGAISMKNPYGTVMGKVLACTDCHEPHGSPNLTLIRKEVNGGILGTITTIAADPTCAPGSFTNYNATKPNSIANLCDRCHKDDYDFSTSCQNNHWYKIHHDSDSVDPFYTGGMCVNCHAGGNGPNDCTSGRAAINCNCCHYHGSTYTYGATTWRTF